MKILLISIALAAIFASCSKEEVIADPYWFNIEVAQGEVQIHYDQDNELHVQIIEAGYKPVFNPDKYPEAVKVNCRKECVYIVNGKTFDNNESFVKP